MRHSRYVDDLARYPTSAHGPASLTWWGTLAFILIEGTAFLLAGAALIYLAGQVGSWPPAPQAPPDLLWGTVQLVLIVASVVPNLWVDKVAHREDLGKVRIGLVVMSLVGAISLVIRYFEFTHLNCGWRDNAYGSIVWVLLGLHTFHLATDLGDTVVLTVLMFTRHVEARRFTDVTDNTVYWNFVVIAWVPIWALLYLLPRMI